MVGFVELWLFSGTNSYDFWHAMFSFFLLQFTLSCLLSYFLPVHLSTRYTGGAGLKKTWSWLTENYQPTGTGNIKKKITIQKNSKEKNKNKKNSFSNIPRVYIYSNTSTGYVKLLIGPKLCFLYTYIFYDTVYQIGKISDEQQNI